MFVFTTHARICSHTYTHPYPLSLNDKFAFYFCFNYFIIIFLFYKIRLLSLNDHVRFFPSCFNEKKANYYIHQTCLAFLWFSTQSLHGTSLIFSLTKFIFSLNGQVKVTKSTLCIAAWSIFFNLWFESSSKKLLRFSV